MQTTTEQPKEIKDITDAYFQACAKLGDLNVKQYAIDEEIDKIKIEIQNLNLKFKKTAERLQKEAKNGTTDDKAEQTTPAN